MGWTAFAIAIGVACTLRLVQWYHSHDRSARRRLAALQPRPIGTITEGLVRIEGRVHAAGATITAPGSDLPCLAYSSHVYEDNDGPTTLHRFSLGTSFWIEDDTGTTRVSACDNVGVIGDEAEIWKGNALDTQLRQLLADQGIPLTDWFGRDRALRYEETILVEGQLASVVGHATVELDPQRAPAGFRDLPRGVVLRDGGDDDPMIIVVRAWNERSPVRHRGD